MAPPESNIPIIILAAGASKRLGRAKQLVTIGGKRLLEKTVEAALAAGGGPVVVVLGAFHEKIAPVIAPYNISVINNEQWRKGMGTSVVVGVRHVRDYHPDAEAVILLVCDQPFLDAEIIRRLIEQWQATGKALVASGYSDTIGVPALFDRRLFDELMNLDDRAGAKKLIGQYKDSRAVIDFGKGSFDIDTPSDLERLKSESGRAGK